LSYRAFTLTPEQVLSLPVDQVALEILRDVATNEGETFHPHNWLNQAIQSGSYGDPRGLAMVRLSEAWTWIQNKGLVTHDPSQSTLGWSMMTRLGRRVIDEGLAPMYAEERLQMELHPRLEPRVRPQFLMGEYELAAFAAMRAIEIRVRELASASESEIGVSLMRQAFGTNGALRDASLDPGEQNATMDLFAGAIGVFKNPSSHRQVEFDDPTIAAEVVLFADLLMRMLDSGPAAETEPNV